MSPEERHLLNDLFDRARAAANAPRDREAEDLIAQRLREQPYTAYLLAQSVLLQDQALTTLTGRVREMEDEIAQLRSEQQQKPAQNGGFLGGLGGLFGGHSSQTANRDGYGQRYQQQPYARDPEPQPPSPWGRAGYASPASGPWGQQQASSGGGFLHGALTTAAGVAGGVLVADAVRDMFSPHLGGGLFGGGMAGMGGLGSGWGGAPIEETVVNNIFVNDGNGGGNDLQQTDDDNMSFDDFDDSGDDSSYA